MRKELLSKTKRVVVKLGTSILTSKANQLDKPHIGKIVIQICALLQSDLKVILVTSGAIASGMGILGLSSRPKSLPKQQASAAIGQSQLMRLYDELFKSEGFSTAQILLTQEDLQDRKRYLNARNTFLTLLDYNIVPIVNENDTVSVDEIKFGDNDRLSGLVANIVDAGLLVILSDVDGLYGKDKAVISVVKRIGLEIERLARGTLKDSSVGGMVTKVQAAKIVTSSGIPLVVANGRRDNVLTKIIDGEDIGTLFLPKENKMVARKRWIAFGFKPHGNIIVDGGAKEALTMKGKSLLSSGVSGLGGKFKIGDMVSIVDSRGREFARGLTNYSSDEIEKIKGLKTHDIEAALSYKYYDEVVHRDNLVIL